MNETAERNLDLNVRMKDEGAKRGFDGINLSQQELKIRLQDLNAKLKELSQLSGVAVNKLGEIGSGRIRTQYESIKREIAAVENEYRRLGATQGGVQNAAKGMLTEQRRANYTAYSGINIISDLQYGYRGVMNNIQQTASQLSFLARAQDQATGKAMGYMGALKAMGRSMVTGANAPLFAMMAITTAIGFITSATGKAENKSDQFARTLKDLKTDADNYAESIRNLNKAFQGMSTEEFNNTLLEAQKHLAKIKDRSLEFTKMAGKGSLVYSIGSWLFGFTDKDLKKYTDLTNEGKKVTNSWAGSIKRQIKSLEELRDAALTKTDYVKYSRQIKALREELSTTTKTQAQLYQKQLENETSRYKLGKITYQQYFDFLKSMQSKITGTSTEDLHLLLRIKSEMKGLTEIMSGIKPLGLAFTTESQKKTFEAMKKQFEAQGLSFNEGSKEWTLAVALAITSTGGKDRYGQVAGVHQIKNPMIQENTRALKEAFRKDETVKAVKVLADSFSNTLTNGMVSAWQKSFGQANSLLQQFLDSFAQGLINLLGDKLFNSVFSGILDSIFPGVSTFLGLGSNTGAKGAYAGGVGGGGGGGLPVPSGNQPTHVSMQLNDRTVGEVLIRPNLMNNFQEELRIHRGVL